MLVLQDPQLVLMFFIASNRVGFKITISKTMAKMLSIKHIKIFDAVQRLGHVFYDIKKSLLQTFADKNINVNIVDTIDDGEDCMYLILGIDRYLGPLPKRFIVYQLEQLENTNNVIYLQKLATATHIWDYSRENIIYLRAHGFPSSQLTLVPVGYSPCLESGLVNNAPTNLVVFYGTLNGRRQMMIDKLRSAGINIRHYANNCWGSFRDKIITEAAIVLNIHYFDRNHILEMSRITVLLSNRVLVISEPGSDRELNQLLEPGLVFVTNTEELVQKTKFYLQHPEQAKIIAEKGYQLIKELFDYQKLVPIESQPSKF